MHKEIALNTSGQSKFSKNLGVIVFLAGLVLLAVTKILVGSKFGDATALVSFLVGGLLCALGLVIARRNKES